MIEAILNKKTNFLTKYYSDGIHNFEDSITSIVFGPLRYVPAHDSFSFFSKLFDNRDADLPFIAKHVRLYFWERLEPKHEWVNKGKWDKNKEELNLDKHVEPDLILEYSGASKDEHRCYMLEIKWNSPESDKQLRKQWDILEESFKKNAAHIFLVKQGSKQHKATTCLWSELVRQLKEFPPNDINSQFNVWREQTVKFLQEIEKKFHLFSGFSELKNLDIKPSEPVMPSDKARKITTATKILLSVHQEVSALERKVTQILQDKMKSIVRNVDFLPINSSRDRDQETKSICTQYLWQYKIITNRKKQCRVAYCLTLIDNENDYPGMDCPTLHVAVSEDDESFSFYNFSWQVDFKEDKTTKIGLLCKNKLQSYSDDMFFALSLTRIQNDDDIEKYLINPVTALIQEKWGKLDKSGVEKAFAEAEDLFAFTPFENGVMRQKTKIKDRYMAP